MIHWARKAGLAGAENNAGVGVGQGEVGGWHTAWWATLKFMGLLGMVANAFKSQHLWDRGRQISESEVNLVYIVSGEL